MNEKYTNILDTLNISRQKCKCCGKDIIYDNTNIKYKNEKLTIKGKSFMTVKVINGIEYRLKVCQDCLLKHYPNIKNLSRIFNVMSEPTKFAFDIPDNIYSEKRKNYAMTKDKMIIKYGEEEGNYRWKQYCDRQSETNTFEYKQKTYGWNEKQFKEYNKSRAVTLKNLISRHGEVKGKLIWEQYRKKQIVTKSWDYMVEKFGIEKARKINQSKFPNLVNFINKYGEELGNKKWINYVLKRSNGVSDISQILFRNLDKYISEKYTTFYHKKTGEYYVWGPDHIYYLDYFIKDLNICIEFNGSCFHGDERIYEDNEYCNPFNKSLTAKDLREKDRDRYNYIYKKYGIKTFVIWELDYNPDTFDYINYIKNTLKLDINE